MRYLVIVGYDVKASCQLSIKAALGVKGSTFQGKLLSGKVRSNQMAHTNIRLSGEDMRLGIPNDQIEEKFERQLRKT